MLFIPQETKDKIAALENENEALRTALEDLRNTEVQVAKPKKSPAVGALTVLFILALAAIGYLLYIMNNHPAHPQEESTEAVLLRDGKIEKWNTLPEDGLVYRVQIGAYQDFSLEKYKQNAEGLHQDSINGINKVSIGAFSRLADAQDFQQKMVQLGLENAYVVAYKNNQPIGLIEAKKQEN